MKKLCIYHANCADGFTAAWAVHKALGDDVEFFPAVHQNPPPDCSGRDVIMVDFCYKLLPMQQVYEACKTLLVLDHHKTAKEVLDKLIEVDAVLNPGVKLSVTFDLERSGAGIAWDFFHPQRRLIVDYVEDRDLGRTFNGTSTLEKSREINACIFSYPYTFENWDRIAAEIEQDFWGVVQEGAAIERKHHKDVAELVEASKIRMQIGGHEVWAANLPYTLTSDAGHLMAKGEPFAACYWDTPEGTVFSLRSDDSGLDVAEIAKGYGGGGHTRAAGFRLPFGQQP